MEIQENVSESLEQTILKKDAKVKEKEVMAGWRQQKAEIKDIKKQERENELREQQLKELRETAYASNVHSKPMVPIAHIPHELLEMKEKSEMLVIPEPVDIDVVPSIYLDINSQTYLAKTLGIEKDDIDSFYINDFLNTKIQSAHLEDTQTNYDNLLNELLDRAGISRGHEKDFTIKKLILYLRSPRFTDDSLVKTLMGRKRNATHNR